MDAVSVSIPVQPKTLELYIECPAHPANGNRCIMLNLRYSNAQGVTYQEVKDRVRREMRIPEEIDFDLDYAHGNQQLQATFHRLHKREPYIRLRICPPARFLYDFNLGMQHTRWKPLQPDPNRGIHDSINEQVRMLCGTTETSHIQQAEPDAIADADPHPRPLDPAVAANELERRLKKTYTFRYSIIFVILVTVICWSGAKYLETVTLFPELDHILFAIIFYFAGCFAGWYL